MSQPTFTQPAIPAIPFPRRGQSSPTTNRRDRTLSPALQELADTLRDQGHSVHTASVQPSSTDDHRLARCAAQFVGQALTLSAAARSVRAHIRVYHSNGLLFLEVTQLRPRSFESAARHRSCRVVLKELSEWATGQGHLLSIRRGPRDQLRIALMVTSVPNDSDEPGRTLGGWASGSDTRSPSSQPCWAVTTGTTTRVPQIPKEA
jgi:hypothetical protein